MRTFESVLNEALNAIEAGRFAEARGRLEGLLAAAPDEPLVLIHLGAVYGHFQQNHLGIQLLKRATAMLKKDTPASVWTNLGAMLRNEMHVDDAKRCYRKALRANPNSVPALANLSGLYVNSGHPADGIRHARKALKLQPAHPQAGNHLGLLNLELGNWAEGWHHYKARWRLPEHQARQRSYDWPEWDGGPVGTLLIHGEQGLGDEIMFLGLMDDVLPLADQVIVECQDRLQGLVRRSWPGVRTYPTESAVKASSERPDAVIAMGDVPALFRDGTPPKRSGYLKPDPAKVAKARRVLDANGEGPHIGIAWMGGTKRTAGHLRTAYLEWWQPILDVGAHLVSVQYGEVPNCPVPQFDPFIKNEIDDQAAVIAACDLVISVCQSAVHLAGAVGTECWCLTPSAPAWRYGVKGEMPWYETVRLYRQTGGDWTPVIEKVAQDLADFTRLRRSEQKAA